MKSIILTMYADGHFADVKVTWNLICKVLWVFKCCCTMPSTMGVEHKNNLSTKWIEIRCVDMKCISS